MGCTEGRKAGGEASRSGVGDAAGAAGAADVLGTAEVAATYGQEEVVNSLGDTVLVADEARKAKLAVEGVVAADGREVHLGTRSHRDTAVAGPDPGFDTGSNWTVEGVAAAARAHAAVAADNHYRSIARHELPTVAGAPGADIGPALVLARARLAPVCSAMVCKARKCVRRMVAKSLEKEEEDLHNRDWQISALSRRRLDTQTHLDMVLAESEPAPGHSMTGVDAPTRDCMVVHQELTRYPDSRVRPGGYADHTAGRALLCRRTEVHHRAVVHSPKR